MKKTFIGLFYNEDILIAKIRELLQKGFDGSELFLVMKDTTHIETIKEKTSPSIQTVPSALSDRLVSLFSSTIRLKKMLAEIDFSKADTYYYFKQLQQGAMLLCLHHAPVDQNVFQLSKIKKSFETIEGEPVQSTTTHNDHQL